MESDPGFAGQPPVDRKYLSRKGWGERLGTDVLPQDLARQQYCLWTCALCGQVVPFLAPLRHLRTFAMDEAWGHLRNRGYRASLHGKCDSLSSHVLSAIGTELRGGVRQRSVLEKCFIRSLQCFLQYRLRLLPAVLADSSGVGASDAEEEKDRSASDIRHRVNVSVCDMIVESR